MSAEVALSTVDMNAMDILSAAPEISTPRDGEQATKKKKKSVGFSSDVSVRVLPDEEADDAFVTRKGEWGAAPDHDELWDGDSKVFWDQEKTLEEVHRIVVMRQLRLTMQYNMGFAFYGIIANFKRRRNCLTSEDVVPQFDNPASEDAALRKELREVFQDSVKGLEYQDLIQDRIAFERMYATLPTGLPGIEALLDEILNVENICVLMKVPFAGTDAPIVELNGTVEAPPPASIENAVGEVEKRRGEQRAAFEAQNNGIPAYGERRASIEARRLADAIMADQELAAAQASERILPPVEEIHEEVAETVPLSPPATFEPVSGADKDVPVAMATREEAETLQKPPEIAAVAPVSTISRKFGLQKSSNGSATNHADARIFAEVFEGTTISSEDRIKYSQRFVREGITSIKQLAGLSTSDLTVLEVKVFDAKQIVRRSWVLSRKV